MVCIAVEYTVFSTAGVSLCRKKRSDMLQSLQTAEESRNAYNYQPPLSWLEKQEWRAGMHSTTNHGSEMLGKHKS